MATSAAAADPAAALPPAALLMCALRSCCLVYSQIEMEADDGALCVLHPLHRIVSPLMMEMAEEDHLVEAHLVEVRLAEARPVEVHRIRMLVEAAVDMVTARELGTFVLAHAFQAMSPVLLTVSGECVGPIGFGKCAERMCVIHYWETSCYKRW